MGLRDPVGPLLDLGSLDLDRAPATPAHQVMVVACSGAAPVEHLAALGAYGIDLARLSERSSWL